MRARSAFVGRGANRLGLEERRVGDDALGRLVEKPGLPAVAPIERVEPQDARARLKPVARRVALGEPRQLGIDFDEIGGRER